MSIEMTPEIIINSLKLVKRIEDSWTQLRVPGSNIVHNIKGFICKEEKPEFAKAMAVIFGIKYQFNMQDVENTAKFFENWCNSQPELTVKSFRKDFFWTLEVFKTEDEATDECCFNGCENPLEGEDFAKTSMGFIA